MRFWRCVRWLGLVLIMSGTPARQVEAAADLARTLVELDEDDRVEAVDGGVGDDLLEAPKADAPAEPSGVAVLLDLARFDLASGGSLPTHAPGLDGSGCGRPPAPGQDWLPIRSSQRQAWLGRFLF